MNSTSATATPSTSSSPATALLTDPLENTNRANVIAKIAAIELGDAYRTQDGRPFTSAMPTSAMPTNPIQELVKLICDTVRHEGRLRFGTTKPDGTPHKLIGVTRLTGLGWPATTPLDEVIRRTVAWYLEHR